MKRILTALFIGSIFVSGSSLFAQSQPQPPNQAEAIANKILEMDKQHNAARKEMVDKIAVLQSELEVKKSNYKKLKQDLKTIRSLLLAARETGTGSITSKKGTSISKESLEKSAKNVLDSLILSDQETSQSRLKTQNKKSSLSEYEEAQAKATKTAQEFKAIMQQYKRKLNQQHAWLRWKKNMLDTQFKP